MRSSDLADRNGPLGALAESPKEDDPARPRISFRNAHTVEASRTAFRMRVPQGLEERQTAVRNTDAMSCTPRFQAESTAGDASGLGRSNLAKSGSPCPA